MSTIFFGSDELASYAKYLVNGGIDQQTAISQVANAAMLNCAAYNMRYNENETPITKEEIEGQFSLAEAARDCGMLVYNCDGLMSSQQEAFFEQQLSEVLVLPAEPAEQIAAEIRKKFDFTVDKFPLAGPDNMPTPHFGLFRSDTGDCVGNACTAKYEPHTVDDLTALAEAGSAAFNGDCKIDCNWRNGHYITITPSDDYRRSIFGTDDNIFPRLIISAGFDGKAFRGSLGLFRDLCDNLQMIRSAGENISASIKHTSGLRENIAELTDKFSAVAARWAGVVDIVRTMEQKQVNLANFLSEVYPESEGDSTRTKNANRRRIQKIFTRILNERKDSGRPEISSDWMVSAWEAFNGVQGFTQHDKTRRGKPSDFDRAVMAFEDSAVYRAEVLAINA